MLRQDSTWLLIGFLALSGAAEASGRGDISAGDRALAADETVNVAQAVIRAPRQIARLLPAPDGVPGNPGSTFGRTISIDGETAVVGAPFASFGAIQAGAAFVFVRSGGLWTEQARLTSPALVEGGHFAGSVSVSGDTLVVAASTESVAGYSQAGAAYVFTRSEGAWTLQAKLTAAQPGEYSFFGASVSLSGDTVVVGAYGESWSGGVAQGAAYVFARAGVAWSQEARLTPADAANQTQFGNAVALAGNTAVIGAPDWRAASASRNGAAYVFQRAAGSWTEQARLLAPDGADDDYFGGSVGLSAGVVLIGAWRADVAGLPDAGAAYVFGWTGSAWSLQRRATASDAAAYDGFGYAVAVGDETAVIGAPAGARSGAGATYVLARAGGSWVERARVTTPAPAPGEYFGEAVAISNSTIVVGGSGAAVGNTEHVGTVLAFVPSGATWNLQDRLVAHDGSAGAMFGWSVALDVDTAVVGAFGDVTLAPRRGSASVYLRSPGGWVLQSKLLAEDAKLEVASFGYSIAVSGDTLVVGAPSLSDLQDPSGSVYVFVRTGTSWARQAKLRASDGSPSDGFGYAVAIVGDRIVVAAVHSYTMSPGAVYVFSRSGSVWTEDAKLVASDAASGDRFGEAVALSGDSILIGADAADLAAGQNAGAAYVFTRAAGEWLQQGKLTAGDGASADYFGRSVSLSGETALVGADGADGPTLEAGAAYVFVRSGSAWAQQAKLTSGDVGQGAQVFGSSVAVAGDWAVVGAGYADSATTVDAGAVYLYSRTGQVWTRRRKLNAPHHASDQYFGGSVALSGATVLVGAPFDNTVVGAHSGSAVVWTPLMP